MRASRAYRAPELTSFPNKEREGPRTSHDTATTSLPRRASAAGIPSAWLVVQANWAQRRIHPSAHIAQGVATSHPRHYRTHSIPMPPLPHARETRSSHPRADESAPHRFQDITAKPPKPNSTTWEHECACSACSHQGCTIELSTAPDLAGRGGQQLRVHAIRRAFTQHRHAHT